MNPEIPYHKNDFNDPGWQGLNRTIPDKPLFYQGKWWFISDERNYFYYFDPIDDWPNLHHLIKKNNAEYDRILVRDFNVIIEKPIKWSWPNES